MNNKLSRLNQVNVSTYLTDLKPGVGELDTQGALVVLDNTGDPNIQNLISSDYGFFIDDASLLLRLSKPNGDKANHLTTPARQKTANTLLPVAPQLQWLKF